MKVTEGLPCPVCQNTLRHYDDCPMLHRTEHLEPGPGAIMQFSSDGGWEPGVVGYRWQVQAKYPDTLDRPMYILNRVDMPDVWFQCTQDIMDRCGRLLMRGEEQAG